MKESTSIIKETINSILEAEKKSDELLANASNVSKTIAKEAIIKSDEIKEKAISDFREFRKKEIIDAEKISEVEYNKKIAEGIEQADSIISNVKDKVDSIVTEQVKQILG